MPERTSHAFPVVVSGPSGVGKTTLVDKVLAADALLCESISVTTREPRDGEKSGTDYFFVGDDRFSEMVEQGELLEYEVVFGNNYGTPRPPVEQALEGGGDVLFDIDWQGTQQVREAAREDLVSVFILPPSTAELERRLHSRAQDSEEVVRARMAKAADEMSHWAEYDYIIINDDLDKSVEQVEAILTAERLKRERRVGLRAFVEGLRLGR